MKIINRAENKVEVSEKRYQEMLKKDEVKQVVEDKQAEPKEEPKESLKCPVCGFVAASKLGLYAHKKKHK